MASPSFFRFLYNHNPFYVLSSCFVLYGLAVAFQNREMTADSTWLLARLLGGYTLLSALTAYLVIRFGRVWEDARSLVLLVLLQFFALSVSFDLTCVTLPETAYQILLAGFCFACATREGLLRSLSLRLSLWFRGPYYAFLGLLFFYPLVTADAARNLAEGAIAGRIFGFGLAAAAVTLGLIPAAIWGRKNTGGDTPWTWPWYPWCGFVFLGGALAFRVYILNLSFSPIDDWRSSFGGYYLTPLAWAWLCVLIALSLADGRKYVANILLWSAPLLLVLSSWGVEDYWQRRFLNEFSAAIGSPIWWTLGGLTLLYGVVWSCGVRGAELGMTVMLLVASCCEPASGWTERPTNPAPLVVACLLQGALAIQRRSAGRVFATAGCCIAAAMVAGQGVVREVWLLVGGGHAILVAALIVGARTNDPLARFFRGLSAVALAGGGIFTLLPSSLELPNAVRIGYPLALAAVGYLYGRGLRDAAHLHAAVVNGGCATAFLAHRGFDSSAEQLGREAALLIAIGAGCFAVAAIISAAKGGVLGRAWRNYCEWLGAYAPD